MFMSNSEPVENPLSSPPRRPVTFAEPPATDISKEPQVATEEDATLGSSAFAGGKAPAHSADLDALDDMGLAAKPRSAMPARRLMYAKSGARGIGGLTSAKMLLYL